MTKSLANVDNIKNVDRYSRNDRLDIKYDITSFRSKKSENIDFYIHLKDSYNDEHIEDYRKLLDR